MPFIEVFDFNATQKQREAATSKLTEALCKAYGITSDIVSTYFFDVGGKSYGHAGKIGEEAEIKRIFIKLHAFPRSAEHRENAASRMTQAAVEAYNVKPRAVVVYFFNRTPDEASHGGLLESLKQE